MLQNARVTITVSELLRKNQQGGKKDEAFYKNNSLTIFSKSSIIDVRIGINYVSAERYFYSSDM